MRESRPPQGRSMCRHGIGWILFLLVLAAEAPASRAAMLSGHVTDAVTAAPVSGASIYGSVLFQPNVSFSATTDADGYYAVDVVDAQYDMSVRADGYVQAFAGAAVSGGPIVVDFALSRPAAISGTVRDHVSGEGIANETVVLNPVDPGNPGGAAQSAPDGSYVIDGVAPGQYSVCVLNAYDVYLDQCYDAMDVPASGIPAYTTVQLGGGEQRTGIDFALDLGSTITGTLQDRYFASPIANKQMTFLLYSSGKDLVVHTAATTGPTGQYALGGIAPGDYYVESGNAGTGVNTFYGFAFFAQKHCAQSCALDDAALIRVPDAGTRTGVDIVLQPGYVVSGKVTDAQSGLGIEGVNVQACELSGLLFTMTAQASTTADGTYVLAHVLGNGATSLYSENTLGYVDLGWPNTPIFGDPYCGGFTGSSPPLADSSGSVANVDFALTPGAAVAGRVTATESPTVGIEASIEAWYDGGNGLTLAWSGITDVNGNYQTSGLQSGVYYVLARKANHDCQLYAGESCVYDGSGLVVAQAVPITLDAAETHAGVDFQFAVEIFQNGFD